MDGKKLKAIMDRQGINVKTLAKDTFLSKEIIYKILNGTRDVNVATAKCIADYLGVKIDDLT